ncbi:AAA family ATPase [Vampirovibrio chlorellavorus]|uniref:AAA family ATPase n=1 Tax=Vampirovibrio chlorellavorus TaxID=758823 RepID=UPI0026EA645A|nr:AAA family ATPase [Vampirovibrio chlorellavorus]
MQVNDWYGQQFLTTTQGRVVAFAGRANKGKAPVVQQVAGSDSFQRSASAIGPLTVRTEPPDSPDSSVGSSELNDLKPFADGVLPDADALVDRLETVSPVLAKWFRPPHYKPGGTVAFLSLPDALIKGIEASTRVSTPRKKAGRPLSGAASPKLEAFLPGAATLDFDRAPVMQVLQKARLQLQQLVVFDNQDDPVAASRLSRQLLSRFLDEPGRIDFSTAAFLESLCQPESAPGADGATPPALIPEIRAVVGDLRAALEGQRRLALDPFEKECPTLSRYSDNLIRRAKERQLPDVLMRAETVERLWALINAGGAHNAHLMLQAPNGEGKTYTLLGLAQRLAGQETSSAAEGVHLLQLDIPALQAEGSCKGELAEEALSQLQRYLQGHPRQKVVLVIDDAQALMPVGDGAQNLPLLLRQSGLLQCQNLTVIGAMTPEHWEQTSRSEDHNFWRQFQPVVLPPFRDARQLSLLGQSALPLEKRYGVRIPPDILEKALRLSRTVWPQGSLERATTLLRGAVVDLTQGPALRLATLNDELQEQALAVATLERQEPGGLADRYQRQLQAARQQVVRLKREIESRLWQKDSAGPTRGEPPILQEQHLQNALATMTGRAAETLTPADLKKLRNAEAVMAQHIVGQPEALRSIAQGLREIAIRHKTGVVANRPIVSLLLPGPTGVGKTEAARVIAREFMNGHLIRLDMSDYMEKHAASLLTGAPPGYVGYEQGGLVDQVRRHPKSVVVFDEIEKAHPDVFNLLLQILGEGELRNNRGEVVSFRDTVVILTSNLNHEALTELVTRHRHGATARKDPELAANELEKKVRALLTANGATGGAGFKPEHLGRIDYVIPFNPLTAEHVRGIVDIQLQQLNAQSFLKERQLKVALSQTALNRLETLARGHELADVSGAREGGSVIAGGARAIGAQFDRYVAQRVLSELAMNPDWDELENACITVAYDAQRQGFSLRVSSGPAFTG